ncbi:unnamed protein product [Urochloa humidicola]
MAEQIITSATSAVTGELTRILFSGLVGRLETRQAAADDDKKLRRLELLLIKVHSAVEASEKHPIENAWLLKWRDKFKEAAAEGGEVLAGFGQPATNSAEVDDNAQVQQEQHSSSATSAPATTTGGASSSARNAPSPGMVYCIRGASSEDIERMNSAVEKLEELSPEIRDFIKLLKVEILALESKSAGTKRKGSELWDSTNFGMRMEKSSSIFNSIPIERRVEMKASVPSLMLGMPTEIEEEERNTLSDRLKQAYAAICVAVGLANGLDLKGHEWLAHWASILREAEGQGRAVLGAFSERRGGGTIARAACEQATECDGGDRKDPELSELGRFVCGMESLAAEVDYFVGLVGLCPSY